MSDKFTKEEEDVLDFIEMKERQRVEKLLGAKRTKKKLVRDLIPGIIAEEGKEVRMCTEIKGDSKIPYYFEKVQEELDELKEAWKEHLMANGSDRYSTLNQVVEEGGDLKEAMEALFKATDIYGHVDSSQIKKRVAKGGFAKGFIMEFDIEFDIEEEE